MGAIRELVAKFVLLFDDRGSRKARTTLQNMERQAQSLQNVMGQIFAATAIAAPFLGLVKLASDAQEQLNVIEVAFEDNAGAVLEWSETWGAAVGRSRYTLQKMVGQMGALVRPMVQNSDLAAEMSMNLTRLAVDIGSLWNISEDIALGRLLSGMSGETEAIKRLGILMTQANLEAYALEKGMGKTAKSMSAAELAQLRFNYIMEKGAFMLGDAERTQYMFANSTRALRDLLKDVGTDLGFFLLPAFTDLVRGLRDMVGPIATTAKAFKEWNDDTNLATGALIGLAAIITALLLPVLFKVAVLAVLLGGLAIVFDEVFTTLKGGDSVLNDFNKALASAVEELESIGDLEEELGTFELIGLSIIKTFDEVLKGLGGLMVLIWDFFTKDSAEAYDTMLLVTGGFLRKLKSMRDAFFEEDRRSYEDFWKTRAGKWDAYADQAVLDWYDMWDRIDRVTDKAIQDFGDVPFTAFKFWEDAVERFIAFTLDKFHGLVRSVKEIFTKDIPAAIRAGLGPLGDVGIYKAKKGLRVAGDFLGLSEEKTARGGTSYVSSGAGSFGSTLPAPAGAVGGGGGMSVQSDNQFSITIEAPANASYAELASMVQDKVEEGLEKRDQDLMASFPAGD